MYARCVQAVSRNDKNGLLLVLKVDIGIHTNSIHTKLSFVQQAETSKMLNMDY
jgi:carbon monoxide dehydrogenase subunit G